VASNVGGIPEIVENKVTGLLISPGDIIGLANAMKILLTDKSLRDCMSDTARKRIIERFMPQHIVQQVEQLYVRLGAVPRTTRQPN
jgi:glycosyltransferase involved in cell wall biosynthesis